MHMFSIYRVAICQYANRLAVVLGLLGTIGWGGLRGQHPGLPFIRSYDKTAYEGGTQNWDFAQSEGGVLLVANNEGLLTFDGEAWEKYPLPNRTIVRSLACGSGQRIYVGGQNAFGYFAPTARGMLQYHSLASGLTSADEGLADIWDIVVQGENVFFRTSTRLIGYDGTSVRTLLEAELLFLDEVAGRVWVQIQGEGLAEWQGDSLRRIAGGEAFRDRLITGLTEGAGGTVLASTLYDGIWVLDSTGVHPWSAPLNAVLAPLRPQTLRRLRDGRLAIATELAGLWIADSAGHLRYQIDKHRGLLNNHVLALFEDAQHNLWAGLHYGIGFVELAAPYHRICPDAGLQGAAYAALIDSATGYFGTSNGLYRLDMQRPGTGEGSLVPGTQGQVWGLNRVGRHLLMGHHEGAFEVGEGGARRLTPPEIQGVWLFVPLRAHPGFMVAGTYEGLLLFEEVRGEWQYRRRLDNFGESCRFLVEDAVGVLWASHPYRGIFRIELGAGLCDVSVQRLGQAEGLPSDLFNHVFFVRQEVIFAGERGLFRYEGGRFVPHTAYAAYIAPDERVIRLAEDRQGHVWYACERALGRLHIAVQGLSQEITQVVFARLNELLVKGFELIYPSSAHMVVFGLDRGFLLFDPAGIDTLSRPPYRALIRAVTHGDSLLGRYGYPEGTSVFSHQVDAFRFSFGATDFAHPEGLRYRYRLVGQHDDWSEWQEDAGKEFTNLPPGSYRFEVEAINSEGIQGQAASYAFRILPPWYTSRAAWVAYGLVVLALLAGLILIPRRRFEREKAELEDLHRNQKAAQQQELDRARAALDHLQREKLESEIRHKSRELATATMHLVQKNEVLTHLRSELERVAAQLTDEPTARQLQDIIRMLLHDQQFDADWEQFATHFDEVHAGFLRRLQEQYPQLTPKDQRLCAYLRMNLSTKEIAPLMNISVRGVEISRYRLRRKLDLAPEVNLNEYMMRF